LPLQLTKRALYPIACVSAVGCFGKPHDGQSEPSIFNFNNGEKTPMFLKARRNTFFVGGMPPDMAMHL